jgi:hypothetical protein
LPRRLSLLPFLFASLGAVLCAQLIGRDPRFAVPLSVVGALLMVPAIIGRWRTRQLLMSGDAERVIGAWEGAFGGVPHPETMAPLLKATAYASYGWIEAGRRALNRAVKGPAWDAAIEQRLYIETLLDVFEGDRESALAKARALEAMPAPATGLLARKRVARLRRGLAAFARAFAHAGREGDAKVLKKAAGASPLVHWAMRYAGAILAVDKGRSAEALALIAGAPSWPQESAFREYHDELLQHARPAA